MLISYAGLFLGYINKGLLFIWFLSIEEIGLVNLLVSIGLLFGNLSGLGSSYAIWKFFPFLKNKEKRHYGFLPLILILAVVGILLFSIVMVTFYSEIITIYSKRSELFVEYYYWVILLGIANILYMIFDSFLRSMYFNIVSVVAYELVLRIMISLLLVVYGLGFFSFETFLILHCFIYFVPVIILAVYLYRMGELSLSYKHISIPRRFRKIILRFSMFSYLNSVGALVVTTIDAMMIAGMLGLKETGIYTTVIYLASALQIPYKSLIRIASPLVAEYWKNRDMKKMSVLYKQFSSVNLFLSLFLFDLIWICRDELFQLLPEDFKEGMMVFLFLMLGRLFDMYMGLNGTIFVTSKKYKYDMVFTVVLIVTVFVMNLILIPEFGMIGAAIATGLAYVLYNIGRMLFVFFAYKIHPFEKSQLYVLLLFTAVLCFFEWTNMSFTSIWFMIPFKWLLLTVLFAFPVYYFNWVPEVTQYINNGFGFIFKKIKTHKKH